MAPNYSANLQNFINKYNSFEEQVESYSNTLDEFYNQVNTLLGHSSNQGNTTSIHTIGNRDYLKTKNGLLIKMDDTNPDIDFSINQINTVTGPGAGNYFYVDPTTMTARDIASGGLYHDSKIIQGGLDNLNLVTDTGDSDNEDQIDPDTSFVKLIPSTYSNNIDALSTGSNGCNSEDVQLCGSYAKMNESKYFGLSRVDRDETSKCSCYIFDNVDGFDDNDIVVNSTTINDTSLNGISYLGIMFDNTFCSLKSENYSDNFSGIYNEKSENINVIDDSQEKNDCNKFTGSGMYDVKINNINVDNICALKDSSS